MRKKIAVAGLLLGMLSAHQLSAQKYLGLSNSNYSGVYGSQYNPAKLAGNKYVFSMNFLSVNGLVDNDLYKFSSIEAFRNMNLNNFGNIASKENQNLVSTLYVGEVLGPSLQFTVNDRLGFGVSSRLRTFGQSDNLTSDFVNIINSNRGTTSATGILSNSAGSFTASSLSDLGVSGAYSVINNDKFRLTLGAGVKLYRGLKLNNFKSNNYNLDYNYNSTTNTSTFDVNSANWEFYTNVPSGGSISNPLGSIATSIGDMYDFSSGSTAVGGNFGAEAVFKGSNSEKPYAFKLGAAIHDLGSITYKDITKYTVQGNGSGINPLEFNLADVNSTVNYLQSKGLTVTKTANQEFKSDLPTHVTAYADYAFTKKFFVSANALVNLAEKGANSVHYNSSVSLAPRWESKWFDVSVPLTYQLDNSDFKPGLAFRIGPLSVGSDDIKVLFTDAKGANVYAGLNFSLGRKKTAEPEVVPAEPVREVDSDGDGIVDNKDRCPYEAGPAENQGCPWPDTDGDGVLDKDDKCPTVPGLVENFGCPKAHETVAKEVTLALKDILFNFGKATINPESNKKLDTAAKIIKDSKGGTYLLVGHTDKKGNEAYNLKLSRERAAAVVQALEERGVPADQLKSKGVGSKEATAPATASDAERQKDRRVEVLHITGSEWEALSKSDVPVAKKKVATSAKGKAPAKKAPVRKAAPKKKK